MTNNKHVGFLVVDALLIASASVWVAGERHPVTVSQPSTAAPAKTVLATANSTDTEEHFRRTRQQMKKMQAQMGKIHQTRNPKGRQRLMAKHMQAMQDTMQTMHGMGSPIMMDIMGGQRIGTGSAAPVMGGSSMPMEQCVNMMENRVDVMQMMMDQMLK